METRFHNEARYATTMAKRTRPRPRLPSKHYLREWRLAKGLTLVQLGDRLAVEPSTISRYESGERLMSVDVAMAVSEALGISFIDLFRPPDMISLDAKVVGHSDETRRQAAAILDAFLAQTRRL